MPSFTGKFQYLKPDATAAQAGSCHLSFDAEALTLTPGSGPPLTIDLGDIDVFSSAEYELTLTLYTGNKIVLTHFGKAFASLSHDLLEAYRKRLVQCLLLEDLEEVARFDGFARLESFSSPARSCASPAELRLYKSNLAVLPITATGFQWRLAEIDAVNFDEANYAVELQSAGDRLTVTKLAKRTGEFNEYLREAIAQLTEKAAQTVHALFPFLTPDQFRQVAELMKEGRGVALRKLKAVHPKTEQALVENVVDDKLAPYFEALKNRAAESCTYAGFKLLREEEVQEAAIEEQIEEAGSEITPQLPTPAGGRAIEATQPEATEREAGELREGKQPVLHWFFFPLASKCGAALPNNLVAWEATSKSGRATYFFRLVPPEQAGQLREPAKASALIESGIHQLNRALVLLNFRREPIYLPDDSLETQLRFRRYAIACRKIPELQHLRASFVDRALHTSLEAWQKQVEALVAKAGI